MDVSSSSSSVSARIRASAMILTKDLLSTSIDGSGALEITKELATSRSAHKISPALSYGSTSSPQIAKPSSKHRHYGGETTECSKKWFELDTADANNDFSQFMLEVCSITETGESSPRSGSTLDLALSAQDSPERWAGVHLKRNDSFNPELSSQESKAEFTYASSDLSRSNIQPEETTRNLYSLSDHLAQSLSWDNYTKTASDEVHKTIPPNSIHGAKPVERKERALGRLQLIFSQMPVMAPPNTSTALKRIDWSESSYNQFCVGEDAQAWAEFEASVIQRSNARALEHGMARDLATRHQYAQGPQPGRATASPMVASKQRHSQANVYQSDVLQSLDFASPQQQQALNGEKSQSNEKDTVETFHCPFIDCHSMCADHLRDTNSTVSLPCVHQGCGLEFATQEVWRKHVSTAHHDLLRIWRPTDETDLEAAWGKFRA
ncbi:hypothetical protein E4T42_02202 [Aureobasidium subglaciale]|nr:hypothetical protein E4T42_02202 [Aureobasidium subglaciale]